MSYLQDRSRFRQGSRETVVVSGGGGEAPPLAPVAPAAIVDVKNGFGALGTAVEVDDVAATAGSPVLTSPSGGFATAQIGDQIEIDGIGAVITKFTSSVLRTATMGAKVSTTIAAKSSATSITIAINATTTAAGCHCVYGPDDFNAFAAATTAGLGVLIIPPGKYILRTGTVLTLQNITIEAKGATVVCGDIYVGPDFQLSGGRWFDRGGMSASGLFTVGELGVWAAGVTKNVVFEDAYIDWMKCEIGINIHHGSGVRINRCRFYERNSLVDPDGGAAIAVTGGNDGKLLNSTLISAREGDDGIAGGCSRGNVTNWEIAGNYVNGFVGVWCCNTHNFNYYVRGISVHDNELVNCAMIARLKPGAFTDIAPGGGILYDHDIHDNTIHCENDCFRMACMIELQIRRDSNQAGVVQGLKFHHNSASGRWANGAAVYKIIFDSVSSVAGGACLREAEFADNTATSFTKWSAPNSYLAITSDGPVAGAEIKGLSFRRDRVQYTLDLLLDARVPDTSTTGEILIDSLSCDLAMVATGSTFAIAPSNGAVLRLTGEWTLGIPDTKRYLNCADTSKVRTDRRIRADLADIATGAAGVVYTKQLYSLAEGRSALLTGGRIFASAAITQNDTDYDKFRLIMFNGRARTILEFGAAGAPLQPNANSITTLNTITWDWKSSAPTTDQSLIGATVAQTVKNAATAMNASVTAQMAVATYTQIAGRTEGSVTLAVAPNDGDTVTVNGTVFTFKTAPTAPAHIQIGTAANGTPTAVASAIFLVEKLRASTDANLVGFTFIREGTVIRCLWAGDDWEVGELKTLAASVATVAPIIVQYSALLIEHDTLGTAGEAYGVTAASTGTTNIASLVGGSSGGLRSFVGDLINTRSTSAGASAPGAPTAITPAGAVWNMMGVTQASAVGAIARTHPRSNGCILAVEASRVGTTGVAMTGGYVEIDILELKRAA